MAKTCGGSWRWTTAATFPLIRLHSPACCSLGCGFPKRDAVYEMKKFSWAVPFLPWQSIEIFGERAIFEIGAVSSKHPH